MKKTKQPSALIDSSKGVLNQIKIKFKPTRLKKQAFKNAKQLADYLRQLFDQRIFFLQEQCLLLLLDEHNMPIGYYPLSIGHKEACSVNQRFILQIILLSGAEAFVIAHNHPNGINQPSEADISTVVSLKHKAEMFDITYWDDMVITKGSYYSFSENELVVGLGE